MTNFCQTAVNTKPLNFIALSGFRNMRTFNFEYREIWNLNNAIQFKQARLNLIDLRNIKFN